LIEHVNWNRILLSVHPLSIVLDSVTYLNNLLKGSFATFRLLTVFSGAGMIWYKRSPRKKHLCLYFVVSLSPDTYPSSDLMLCYSTFNSTLFGFSIYSSLTHRIVSKVDALHSYLEQYHIDSILGLHPFLKGSLKLVVKFCILRNLSIKVTKYIWKVLYA
jgi:hypothetical protein